MGQYTISGMVRSRVERDGLAGGCLHRLVEVPQQVAREHADEHVAPDPVYGFMASWMYFQLHCLHVAEILLHIDEGLVCLDKPSRSHPFLGHIAADCVEAAEPLRASDRLLVAAEGNLVALDFQLKYFSVLYLTGELKVNALIALSSSA
ncbi:MAG: hypothetical protein FWG10_13645 [Eubacteriaceae bacterium]|nr:hypothetical protein [Eubacteriaceae bacterium]